MEVELGWRIEELAARSGLAVDTIRFYQREGLLPAAQRNGRIVHYGPEHLDRLARIRSLQAGRLSLAAIRSVLTSSRASLADAIFSPEANDLTLGQLVDSAGVPLDLADELTASGLLRTPASLGRNSYDDADIRLLTAVRELLDAGIPRSVVVRLARIYAEGFARLQGDVLTLFTEPGDLTEAELAEMQDRLAAGVEPVLRAMERVLAYCHQRTVQAMTVSAIEEEVALGEATAAPARGA